MSRDDRPFTVTEHQYGLREEVVADAGIARERIFFPHEVAQRTTQWERGDDPKTELSFTQDHDAYGFVTGVLTVAVPRGRDPRRRDDTATQPYLSTYARTEYARRDDTEVYIVDRVARATTHEVRNDGRSSVIELRDTVFGGDDAADAGGMLRVIGHRRTYYDGLAHVGLELGRLGQSGLLSRVESLAATDEFLDDLFDGARPPYLEATPAWTDEYPEAFRGQPPLAGYRRYTDGEVTGSPGGYFITTASHAYDPRGLPVATRDPMGAETRTEYDRFGLLVTAATDPADLVTRAVNDYRILRPRELTDVNGNVTAVAFSPGGFVVARFVRGRNGEGDATTPSVTMEYDLLAFHQRREPISVRTVRRLHHDTATDVSEPERSATIVAVEYSDGFGRLLQTRTQAEDMLFGSEGFGGEVIPAEPGSLAPASIGRSAADDVAVSGWQVYDNKGRVVERYEPFFAHGFAYAPPGDSELGQKAVIFYDPRGRAIRTANPDGSEELVVLGVPVDLAHPDVYTPTAWETFTYDANDNAGRTHPDTAAAYSDHWNTPASIEVDGLDRTVVAIARTNTEELRTRSSYDIQGNLVAITDALDRVAFRYRFDLLQRPWRTDSIDAGHHDTVIDALGNPIESRDAKGALTLRAFDVLRRPSRVWARDAAGLPVTLRQRIVYGDEGDRTEAQARNLLGRAVAHHDEAGLVTIEEVDFKGNVRQAVRQVIADAPLLAIYAQAATQSWEITPFTVDWDQPASELLDPTEYRTTTSYDALNRITRHVLPDDVEGHRRVIVPRYNPAGGLEQVTLDDTVYVRRIAYDAKGQRTLIAYGNNVLTRYAYDPHTFRLARLLTQPYTPDGGTFRPTGPPLQDHGYTYDLVGNILTIRDRTPGSGVVNTPAGVDTLDRAFVYDPLNRLVSATGRECDLPPELPFDDRSRGVDITRTRSYTETYVYDRMGSLLRLAHTTGPTGFVRTFAMADGTNRLSQMTASGTPFTYTFDDAGNLTSETTTRHFAWNHADQLVGFATQTPGAEPSVHAQYLYDASGERVTKLVRRQGGAIEVTHYLGDIEHHRWAGPSPGANNHIHVMDDKTRIALVRIGPAASGDGGVETQFHYGDHLGSIAVVADENGAVTNREEFTPYGETSFGSFARKRYRFTGKERDSESGMSYHFARYYAPWLTRWASADPIGASAGVHLYRYAADNPVLNVDPNGHDDQEAWRIDESKPVKPKVKVLGGAAVDEPIKDSSGEDAGQVSILKGTVKLNPVDIGVEGTVSVLDAQLNPKIAGPVRGLVSGTVGKAKLGISTTGVDLDATAFEAGVGLKVGPVGGKLLFGLSGGVKYKDGVFKVKAVVGIGGELELDSSSVVAPIFPIQPQLLPAPDLAIPEEAEQTSMHVYGVSYETVPPKLKPQPSPRHQLVRPEPKVYGCEFGPDGPGPHGKAYVGASPLR